MKKHSKLKASREQRSSIVEAEAAEAELERVMREGLADGSMTETHPEYLRCKRALKQLRDSIGLARKRSRP